MSLMSGFLSRGLRLAGTRFASSAAAKDELPVLYSYFYSSCSWRVRIALGLKRIPHTIKATSLLKEDAVHCYTDEYKQINPMQQVPCLQIDGHTLCDSVAIMHYLDETRSEHPLLPADPVARAKVREIVEIICSGIQPLQNRLVLSTFERKESIEWANKWISRGFRGLEKVLSNSAGKYCVGDNLTMADCCLVPQVFNARRYKVDLIPYPTILRLVDTLEKNEVISACHPHKQPDYPKK